MAKAALEMSILDAELRAQGESLGRHLGAVRLEVDCGVSVGIQDSIADLLKTVSSYLDQGYQRIKLKIEPGWDVEPVRALRASFGNTCFRLMPTLLTPWGTPIILLGSMTLVS